MNRILLFCALGALFGCKQATAPSGEVITLCYSTSEPSKTDALTAGDAVTVFARIDGTEHYFLESAKFITGSDGHSLTYGSTVYYPETKQAINFYAYFGGAWDEGQGTCSVPSDQSTPAALKQADLCWATASTTPVPTAVALPFSHLLARLIVHTNEPTSKIACQVVPSGTLNPATGQFTLNGGKSEVFTTGSELILPVQPLSHLVLTVSGIEYVFEGSINLQSGQTTTLNLTLNPSTKTATLNGSSTTAWTASSQQGIPGQTVSNILTLHWANYVPQGATPDKITLTINNTDYTISSGITYANKTFVVPFASAALRYPYTISKITFFSGSTQALPGCTQLLGATIYKSAKQTLGIKDPANAIKVGNLWWATGNLVADGPNGCRIGAPTDNGLYFAFGSLIGWSGGAAPNYDGSGSFASSAAAVKVWPMAMGTKPAINWPLQTGSSTTLNQPYFSIYTAGYNADKYDISTYAGSPTSGGGVDVTKSTLREGRYAPLGVGDPCTYYLGTSWKSPNINDFQKSFGASIPKQGTYWYASGVYFPLTGFVMNSTSYSSNGDTHTALHLTNTTNNDWQNYQLYSSNGGNLAVLLVIHTTNDRRAGNVARCVTPN